ncbi:TPA: hypothetical protein ACQ82H_004975 [Klebsiella pneumoniae]|uniref:hypothetical protein n=1 Tax=Klebsiella pneumoniae TaxID=573 RepID=UPI0029646A08|nr:hypothetical protein [Klebsiella pneumoniae]MDW1264049.1 hypothetical protein [Klebsiella pneumoniae]
MNKALWIAVFLLALIALLGVFFSYYYWFKLELGFHISKSPEVWGQFGDFAGGLINPILSFITVVILIITSLYQQKQYERLERREKNKIFNDRFYGMISYQRDFANDFKCKLPSGVDANVKELIIYVEGVFFDTDDHSYLNDDKFKDSIFPLVRGFYILVKMINESRNEEIEKKDADKYYEWLVNLTDYSLMRLVLLCVYYYDGISSFSYIKSNSAFIAKLSMIGWGDYIDEVKKRKLHIGN